MAVTLTQVVSLEGDTTFGEQGGVPGESTIDTFSGSTTLKSDFEVETPSVYMAGGVKSLMQRIYVEADTQGQTMQVFSVIDGVATQVGTLTTTTGKTQVDFCINLPGYIHAVRIFVPGSSITKRMEVSALELDLYRPA